MDIITQTKKFPLGKEIQFDCIQRLFIDTPDKVLTAIRDNIHHKTRLHVVVVDAALFIKAKYNAAIRDGINSADLVLSRGTLFLWGLKQLVPWITLEEPPVPKELSRHTLVDVMNTPSDKEQHKAHIASLDYSHFLMILLRKFAYEKVSFFFLGGKRNHIQTTQKWIQQAFPKILIHGFHSASSLRQNENSVLEKLRKASPDIVILDIGHGTQELWISQHRNVLPHSFCITLDGGIESFSGKRGLWHTFQKLFQKRTWQELLHVSVFISFVVMHKSVFKKRALSWGTSSTRVHKLTQNTTKAS